MKKIDPNRFVILSYARTRSNYFKNLLNHQPDISCEAEIFGHDFLNERNINRLNSLAAGKGCKIMEIEEIKRFRENEPHDYLTYVYDLLANGNKWVGFKLFPFQNDQIFNYVLGNEEIKKIVLIRNFLYSFVSLQQAQQTGQWILLDEEKRNHIMIAFNFERFKTYVEERIEHVKRIMNGLEQTGQDYYLCFSEDVGSQHWWSEIFDFFGVSGNYQVNLLQKKQNPNFLELRVANYREMVEQLRNTEYASLLYGDFIPNRIDYMLRTIIDDPLRDSFLSRQKERLIRTNGILEKVLLEAKENNLMMGKKLQGLEKDEAMAAERSRNIDLYDTLEARNKILKNNISLLKHSWSYRIGYNIARIPMKVGSLVRLGKENQKREK